MSGHFVFLDRDGTICEDMHYLDDYRKMVFFGFAVDAVKLLREKGYTVVVISNQSGVARGRFGIGEALRQQNHVLEYFREGGAPLDAYLFCPHHPEGSIAEFAVECGCRKPKTGLIDQIAATRHIDRPRSWVVGDKMIDVELACRAGMQGALVLTGYGARELAQSALTGIATFRDILDFAKKI